MSLFLFLTVVCLTVTPIRTTLQACIPVPIRPVEVDLDKSLGIWYDYVYGDVPGAATLRINVVGHIERLGYLNKDRLDVQAQYEEVQYRLAGAPDIDCWYTYFQSNRSALGISDFNFYVVSSNGTLLINDLTTVYNLYHDPDFFEIYYRCLNTDCTSRHAHVRTRKNPNDLTDAEKTVIKATTDATLAPYCMSFSDLPLQIYNSSLPLCDYIHRPAGFFLNVVRIRSASFTECEVQKTKVGCPP